MKNQVTVSLIKASCSDSFQISLSFKIPVCGSIIRMMVVPLSAPFVTSQKDNLQNWAFAGKKNFKWSCKKLQCPVLISDEFVYRIETH